MIVEGLLLDVDQAEEGLPFVTLYLKRGGRVEAILDKAFEPSFYLIAEDPHRAARMISKVEVQEKGRIIRPKGVEVVRRRKLGREMEVVRVVLEGPRDLTPLRHAIRELPGVKGFYGFDLPLTRQYLIERGLVPLEGVRVEGEEREGTLIATLPPEHRSGFQEELEMMSFDIEVYNPGGIPRSDRDPVIMVSLAAPDGFRKVLTWKEVEGAPDFVEVLGSEREMLERFVELVGERGVDLLLGYNTDFFDFPYLRERARRLGVELGLGREGGGAKTRRRKFATATRLPGRVHVDVYAMVNFLATIGAIRLIHYTLEDVYRHVLGKEKPDFEMGGIARAWEKGGEELKRLFEYSLSDAQATLELGQVFLPLFRELTKLVGQTLFDVTRMTPGQLVEWLLVREAFGWGELVPPRPKREELDERMEETYVGAYVMEPKRGLHENLVAFDFRSLYPSIIVSHNIDPSTLNCDCCGPEEATVVPELGYRFCRKRKGFVPSILERLIERRAELKKELKRLKPGTPEYLELDSRQMALKIVSNSFYGMFGYAGARWYSKECAESITSLGRHYIHQTIARAEREGMEVVYADTDGLYCKMGEKSRGEILRFLEEVNRELPGVMELELEGFYPRGVFITKKRYALIDEEGRLIVKGLEFVRRDWAAVAKRTQQEVLDAILREGSPKKAAEVIKRVVRELQQGRVDLQDLVIYTQLKMPIESYRAIGPHVVAAKKLRQKGYPVEPGAMIAYVEVKGPGSISDRATPVEDFDPERMEYDANYYIEHQVLPAVMRIMEVLGYREEDLRSPGGEQTKLGRFF
ncbi:MAG: DNA-directed DNA polymerase [Candidatus Hadarchaeales archaeon]